MEGAGEAITAVEGVLRELIRRTLKIRTAADWVSKAGVSPQTLRKWEETEKREGLKRTGVRVPNDPFSYSYLSDLPAILQANWSDFEAILGDLEGTLVYLRRLAAFRNTVAHGRELTQFEKQLAIGMSSEIRNKITLYESERVMDADRYFPRIESARDSFGNVVVGPTPPARINEIDTGITLRPGDVVTFQLNASDPDDVPHGWRVTLGKAGQDFVEDDVYEWTVSTVHIGDRTGISFALVSERGYHRVGTHDGMVAFRYRVFPRD